jgi:hypothetical protein
MQQCTVGRGLQPTVDLASNDLREMGEAAAVITISAPSQPSRIS